MTGRIEVGLQRDPDLDPGAPLPASDPRLTDRIAAEIRASGPMTFARFMEIALYDPEAGYYARPPDLDPAGRGTGPGRRGDFLTAPESHPIFGWAVARRLEQAWIALNRPKRFVVREHGAGSGGLAVGILEGLRRSESPLLDAIRYQAIDVSRAATMRLEAAVARTGLADALEPADARAAVGAVLANELLDALPFHRIEGADGGGILEHFVALDATGALTDVPGPPSTPALARRLAQDGVRLDPGQAAEVCLAIDDWFRRAARPLERGLVLIVDYGEPAERLYGPARGPTLRAYHRHRAHADPFVAIGRQDLTAHVDLTAVERAAAAAGLLPLRRVSQATWLADLGLGELLVGLQAGPGASLEAYLAARSAVVRLLDPRATGGFAVLEFGRDLGSGGPAR